MTAEPAGLKGLSFEQALSELETIVQKLETGSAPLDESIRLYERGAELRTHCEMQLKSAELKVEQIVQGARGEAAGTEPSALG
jgi:exodeoxyribonuclease VII small subunit